MPAPKPVPQLRHALVAICPPFLRGTKAHSFTVEGLFTVYDIDADLWWQSLVSRWPTYAPSDALPYLAADRRLIIGPYESEAAQRARIRGWVNEWVLSGLPLGWLIAMQAYGAPNYPRVRLVTKGSIWYTLEENTVPRLLGPAGYEALPLCPYESGSQWPSGSIASPIERLRHSGLYERHDGAGNWDWDSTSNPERAACWWDAVGIIYGNYEAQDPYDSGLWVYDDPLESLGFDEPYGTFTALRAIAKQRKSCKSVLRAIIWTPNDTDFDPTSSPAEPDGTWGWDGIISGGVLVPTRKIDCRYLIELGE